MSLDWVQLASAVASAICVLFTAAGTWIALRSIGVPVSKAPPVPGAGACPLASIAWAAFSFPAAALPGLQDLVEREGGEVPVIGPGSPKRDVMLPALRTVGYRKTGNRLVPVLHAKMVLLGEGWRHDEVPLGGVADVIWFEPQRLWVGSANGTASSRDNLECGFWLDDPALLGEARKFLTGLLRYSENFDPDANDLTPGLVDPEYDDEAFAEALGDMPLWEDYEDEGRLIRDRVPHGPARRVLRGQPERMPSASPLA